LPPRPNCGQYFQESSAEKIFASERQLQNWQTISINGAALDGSLSQFFNKEARRDRQKASAGLGVWHPFVLRPWPSLSSDYQMPTFPQQKPTKTQKLQATHTSSKQRKDCCARGLGCARVLRRSVFPKRHQWFARDFVPFGEQWKWARNLSPLAYVRPPLTPKVIMNLTAWPMLRAVGLRVSTKIVPVIAPELCP
jgi:hypothetical protein